VESGARGEVAAAVNGLRAAVAALVMAVVSAAATATVVGAQGTQPVLRVRVVHDSLPVRGATVRVGFAMEVTNGRGVATLTTLAVGPHLVLVARLGFIPETTLVTLRARQDTLVTVALERAAAEIERVVVAATRAERLIEDTPLRVEVVDEEEVAEKTIMTPGDVTMMMNETSGLRVATTAPSLGGANVRILGMRGRYSLVLTDGLPLGAQGSFGLLQIPPIDLARMEVIKGGASALYGANALGGVINLVSRRPSDILAHEVLLNQTSRGGSDVAYFGSGKLRVDSPLGATLLASGHRQPAHDVDGDGWIDLSEYTRGTVRPRVFFDRGRVSALGTLGYVSEDRVGGTLPGRIAPDSLPFPEGLDTRRMDGGLVGRVTLGERGIVAVRAAASRTRHAHRYGPVTEHDRHGTWFTEMSLTIPREPFTFVAGGAHEQDGYAHTEAPEFDYTWRISSAFGQADVDVTRWLTLSLSARADKNDTYARVSSTGGASSGTSMNFRGSALLRAGELSARFSGGTGVSMPTVLIEETEAIGLLQVAATLPLQREFVEFGSIDLMGSWGPYQVTATVHASRLHDAVTTQSEFGVSTIRVLNALDAVETWGTEILARWIVSDALRVTASHTFLDATEWNPATGSALGRREVSLSPRQTASMDLNYEVRGLFRAGAELFCTGRQALDDNPYREWSAPYCVYGFLAERNFSTRLGNIRAFVNTENLGDVRQSRWHPLVRPSPGPGGRWTTDAWTDLAGRTINGGARFVF
jgi:outer membrane receptor for ferrienterochelin and colicins